MIDDLPLVSDLGRRWPWWPGVGHVGGDPPRPPGDRRTRPALGGLVGDFQGLRLELGPKTFASAPPHDAGVEAVEHHREAEEPPPRSGRR